MFGWSGTLLFIDLTSQKVVKKPLKKDFARAFLGGRGFNSKILYDEFTNLKTSPYDPQNIVCISSGLLGGTIAPSSSRITVSVAKSPVNDIFGDGNAGGHFGPELRYAGYDALIIRGRAEKLCYLLIDDDHVEIKNSENLKDKTIWDADEIIKEDIGDPDIQILGIGPPGERLAALAIPICNLARAPGGAGTGAVMGSKNLKAVAVRGTKGVKVAKPKEFEEASEEAFNKIKSHPLYDSWSKYGTSMLMGIHRAKEEPLFKNNQISQWEGCEKLDGPYFIENFVEKSIGCFNCPLHCSHFYVVKSGPYAGTSGEGCEFETFHVFGPGCGNTEPSSVLYLNNLTNCLGLDVVQTGSTVYTALHWWQDGLIDAEDTGGMVLEWGNPKVIIDLVNQIAYRKGFGDVLADGPVKAARKISEMKGIPLQKLESYILHVKGRAFHMADSRTSTGNALEAATSTRGADHLRGLPTYEQYFDWYASKGLDIVSDLGIPSEIAKQWLELDLANPKKYDGKGYLIKFYQDQCSVVDSLGICKFTSSWRFGVGPELMAKLVSAATGIDYSWKDILACGDRIYTVEYAMQRRFGLRKESDYLPEINFNEPIRDGPKKGTVLDKEKFGKMLREYYEIRGYDEEGIPTSEKLEELGLKDVAEDLKKCCIPKASVANVKEKKQAGRR